MATDVHGVFVDFKGRQETLGMAIKQKLAELEEISQKFSRRDNLHYGNEGEDDVVLRYGEEFSLSRLTVVTFQTKRACKNK